MNIQDRPAWLRMMTDGLIAAAIILGAVYALSSQAGASEEVSVSAPVNASGTSDVAALN